MRYLILILLGIFGVIMNGSLLAGVTVMGLQIDVLLLIILALVLSEKTSMPILFAAASGLFMDIMYSTAFGFYAISYTVVAGLAVTVFMKFKRISIITVFLVGGCGYILKETVSAIIIYIMGQRFGITHMYLRYILPGALLTGVLLISAYWLISKLMKLSWMRPRLRHSSDDISHLNMGS